MCKICSFVIAVYRCEIWSLKLKEEHRLGVSLRRILRKICELKREKKEETRGNFVFRSIMIYTFHRTLLRYKMKSDMGVL